MGRKIPGRKHRGVRDPEKQRKERFAKIKDKINAAPSNPEDQQISKSLSRIIDLKNKVKDGLFNKKKKKALTPINGELNKLPNKKFTGHPEKPIPKFQQLPGETDRAFKHRMNRICSEIVKETAFEDKYQVDIKKNEEGEVEGVEKRPKDELEVLVKKLKKEKQIKKKGKGKKKEKKNGETELKLTKSQKWARKKAEKKKKQIARKEEEYSFESRREQVRFGEIVDAPPTLVSPKKVSKLESAPRPGQKPLLLTSLLKKENSSTVELPNRLTAIKRRMKLNLTKTIDKKAKRKSLPHALRRQLDRQQKEIIESYKKLKSEKYSAKG